MYSVRFWFCHVQTLVAWHILSGYTRNYAVFNLMKRKCLILRLRIIYWDYTDHIVEEVNVNIVEETAQRHFMVHFQLTDIKLQLMEKIAGEGGSNIYSCRAQTNFRIPSSKLYALLKRTVVAEEVYMSNLA